MITYTLVLFGVSSGLVYFSHDETKSISSILNVVLIIVPLVSTLFGAMHYYNSKEFIQMLLTQPVKRKEIFKAEYSGISISLSLAFLIGVILPLSFYGISKAFVFLLITGIFLSFIFSALALLFSISIEDKVKGIGVLLFLWLFFSVLFDGLILIVYFTFGSYPLEKFTIIMTLLNPVDISRIMILLNLDLSALLGYTGATFLKFFGSFAGLSVTISSLFAWLVIPVILANRKFKKKDF
ncbi:MAG: ABC transporter permease subunit [Ignavibacteriae bacterium]|nr:ABC transporter permease subunit [Ignavibacteriota bacterium]